MSSELHVLRNEPNDVLTASVSSGPSKVPSAPVTSLLADKHRYTQWYFYTAEKYNSFIADSEEFIARGASLINT